MITAPLACIQKIENGGETDDRFVALVFTIAHNEGGDRLIPAVSLMITVPGKAADRFEVGKLYSLDLTEAPQ